MGNTTLSNSLPFAAGMGRAAGTPPPAATKLWSAWKTWWNERELTPKRKLDDEALQPFKKEWDAAEAEWKKALREEKDAASRAVMVARLMSLPIDSILDPTAIDAPTRETFRRAADFIKEVPTSENIRPIEAHFLVMMDKWVLPAAPPERLQGALHLRRVAEGTLMGINTDQPAGTQPTYCEIVFPLIKSRIVSADKTRRQAEDKLFGPKSQWDDVKRLLTEAEKDFADIQRQTKVLREALLARDRGWADLPYLAQWLSCRPIGDDPKAVKRDFDALNGGVAKLVELTKTLDRLAEPVADDELQELGDVTRAVDDTREKLFREHRPAGKERIVENQLQFHQIEAVLGAPLIDQKKRVELLQQSRKITATLNRDTSEHTEKRRRIEFPDAGKVALGLYERALDIPAREKLFEGLAKLPDSIRSGLQASLQKEDLAPAMELLRRPVQLCRLIPGGRVADSEGKIGTFTAPEGLAPPARA